MKFYVSAAVFGLTALLTAQTQPKEQVGPQPDGSLLLNTGWRVKPAGRQVPLGTFPMSSALSPDGKHLLVLNAGFAPPSIVVLNAATAQEVSRVTLADAWLGLTFAPNGKFVYVGGGSRGCVYEYSFSPGGKLALTRTLAAAGFIGDVAVSPDGHLIYAAAVFQDLIYVINPQSGRVIEKFATGRRPYRILFHPDGQSYFVSSWVDGTVYQNKAGNGEKIGFVRLGQHPTDMVWRAHKKEEQGEDQAQWAGRIFVSAANTNNVYVIGVSESKEIKAIETINVAMTPRHPLGMTPSAVALSADQGQLYVACSDANAVAVADISEARSHVLGFIPTGPYPTAVRSMPGGRLFVLNGHGAGGKAAGSASIIPAFNDDQLRQYTKTSLLNSPFRDEFMDGVNTGQGNPVPSHPGDPTPIEHVIYIVKDGGSNDNETITPNQQKLAREFVRFDNFYANGFEAADGHQWSFAAIANDYVQKLSPNSNAGRRQAYDYEGLEPTSRPPAGYLWSNAVSAGLSIRNYGWWVTNVTPAAPEGAPQVARVNDDTLARNTNMDYRGFDSAYHDTDRVKLFIKDLAGFEAQNKMPKLIFIRLAKDDALGMIVEAVTKSKFWAAMAIFVTSADTDDSRRAPAVVISPYTRRGIVDSNMYNTASVLRTMELILGLRPMTHFDAGARPMSAAFTATPDVRPYTAEKPAAAKAAATTPSRSWLGINGTEPYASETN